MLVKAICYSLYLWNDLSQVYSTIVTALMATKETKKKDKQPVQARPAVTPLIVEEPVHPVEPVVEPSPVETPSVVVEVPVWSPNEFDPQYFHPGSTDS